MNHEDEIKRALYTYEEAGLIEGDPVKVLSLLSDDVIGIGIGEQGFVSSKEDVREIMMRTVKKDATADYKLEYENVIVNFNSNLCANICAKVTVLRTADDVTTTSCFLQSLSFIKRDGSWLISQLHASPILLSEESIDTYPLAVADSTLANLRAELQLDTFELINKSFSGGVFGTYISGNYPLYFVNDTMVRQMGYTIEEFTDAFNDDVTLIIHDDDRERVVGEIADALNNGRTEFELRFRIKTKDGGFYWVIQHSRKTEDANGIPVLLVVTADITEMVELQQKLEQQNDAILSSIKYASKIQRNLLPPDADFSAAFADHAAIWSPKDVVGGDIYWLKKLAAGTVLVVCDCTGHGTPGALLTMLVASVLDAVVDERSCDQPARIMAELDTRISTVLNARDLSQVDGERSITHIHDGCDLAVFFVAKDGSVTFVSSGMPVFLCDGCKVTRFRAQQRNIGNGSLSDLTAVKVTAVPPCPGQKFYVSSDGLYDQIGGEGIRPFGYQVVQDIILKRHAEPLTDTAQKLWEAFELHRGENIRRDDVALVAFQP